MSRRRRRGGKNKRHRGFSGPGQRQAWEPILRGAGIGGREKRSFFNTVSGIMVLSAGVAGACFGYSLLGFFGAVVGFIVAAGLVGKFVKKGRYLR